MTRCRLFLRLLLNFVLVLQVLCAAAPVSANSGGEGAGGPAPMNFVINVGPTGRGGMVLQLQLVAVPANPEAAKKIDLFRPMLQHRVIQVVGALKPEDLRSVEEREKLAAQLVEEFNADLDTTEKTGVKEVFFTAFVFQPL